MERQLCTVLAVQLGEKLRMHVDHATSLKTAEDYKNVMAVVFALYQKLDTGEEQTHCSLDLLPPCVCKLYD
ncbi:hypothetical protein KIN20_025727 [Parelaphostrongylus tenuis]|uniref:Uncharacterized protein n=1 Tax=Parelaphostrongylus tenuis TaxID=148309 RepID=A0AAD5MZS4_PARTN|nr:hypothetical protein KIN20_025727 [Parelaphostrongylus tenuis]